MKDTSNNYVVGFAFTNSRSRVLLLKKEKPPWQKGLLNGIGGKIKHWEAPMTAMCRESEEEVGLKLDWVQAGIIEGIDIIGLPYEVHIFFCLP